MRKLHAFLISLSLTPALAQTQRASSLPDLQSVGALGQELFLQSGATGMVLVVVRNQQALVRGYGETAPGSHQLPTADSTLRLCSLTKIFTSDLLIKLSADKTVQLDDPLQRFAPPHVVVPTRVARNKSAPITLAPITLIDLATHTSGLPRELGNAPPSTPHFTYPDYATRWHWLPNQRLHTVPGTAALYSNIGYDLLGDALQFAARTPYVTLLAQRTLNPLHMYQTTFFPSPIQCTHLLIGSGDEGPCTSTQATAGSSGLYSTATDMAIWLKYLLGTGPPAIPAQNPAAQAAYILPASLVSEKGLDHAGKPTGIGLGWIHLLPPGDPSHIIEKTGGGAGYETYMAINRPTQTAIFLAATDGPADTHLNLYNAANKLLLSIAGLPPLPPPMPQVSGKQRRTRHKNL